MTSFKEEVEARLRGNAADRELLDAAAAFMRASTGPKYSYNFSWLGRPIIQYPQDLIAMQELIWAIQPELIIETGIAHGGSLIYYASLLELVAACGGPGHASVLGIDVDIRAHNRAAIEAHPLARRIEMIQGSSLDPAVVGMATKATATRSPILVCLDSNHTADHVYGELEAYAPLTTVGSYCVVFDTIVDDLPPGTYPDRPWGPGNNPKTAVRRFLANHPQFEVDEAIDHQLLISVAPGGYLKRVS